MTPDDICERAAISRLLFWHDLSIPMLFVDSVNGVMTAKFAACKAARAETSPPVQTRGSTSPLPCLSTFCHWE